MPIKTEQLNRKMGLDILGDVVLMKTEDFKLVKQEYDRLLAIIHRTNHGANCLCGINSKNSGVPKGIRKCSA